MGNYFAGFDFTDFWDDSDYAPGFVEEWLKSRKKAGVIIKRHDGLWMSEAAVEALRGRLG